MAERVLVGDDGPTTARLVLVGEAPGRWEEEYGRPFVGPSGGRLAAWWRTVGLSRSDFYITNVLPWRPASIDAVPREEIEAAALALRERLARLPNVRLVIPTGNYALYALTGLGRVSWHQRDGRLPRAGIMDWRGSILATRDARGRTLTVIPTIHPAAVLRQPGLERRTLADWRRIADAARRETPPVADTVDVDIHPTADAVEEFVESVIATELPVALDIETPRGRVTEFLCDDGVWRANLRAADRSRVQRYKSGKRAGELKTRTVRGQSYIGCIGLAVSGQSAMVIPTVRYAWPSAEAWERVQAAVHRLCDSAVPLVVQNGVSFDLPRLLHDGFPVRTRLYNGDIRSIYDTRAMHHCLDARDDHDLAYLASIYTRLPFWKHDAKLPDEVEKYASNSEALWRYCGIDAAATIAVYYALRRALEAERLWEFYRQHYIVLTPVLLDLTMHGIAVDTTRLAAERARLDADAAAMREELVVEGMPLVAKNGISPIRLKYLLYGEKGFEGERERAMLDKLRREFPHVQPFGLRLIRKKNAAGERTPTVDEVAVRQAIIRDAPRCETLLRRVLAYRENRKRVEFLDPTSVDADGRLRCSYSFVTEAGRLSSSSTPWGTGRNLQNIDRTLRDVFVPDPGCIFLECDMSQAESRVVFMLTGDPELQRLARLTSVEYDAHSENARLILGAKPSDPDWKIKRHIGKIVSHGAQRDMRGAKLSGVILKELDRYISPEQCDDYLERYHRAKPAIRDRYFRDIRKQLMRTRCLVNSFGRRLSFAHDRLGDDVFRQAYSFLPQSEVADALNRYILLPVWELMRRRFGRPPNVQVHDSVLLSVPPEAAFDVATTIVQSVEANPLIIRGEPLVIPVEFKLGINWAARGNDGVEFKQLPSRDEFTDAAMTLWRRAQ